MGTRSLITARIGKSGEFRTIYCHWDGYVEGVGKVLQEDYASTEKIDKLIDGGDLSSISPDCFEYYSAKGEPWEEIKPIVTSTLRETLNINMGQEFHYLWDVFDENIEWKVSTLNEIGFTSVETILNDGQFLREDC